MGKKHSISLFHQKIWWKLPSIFFCLTLSLFFVFHSARDSRTEEPIPRLDPKWYTPKTARGEELKNNVIVGNCFLCHAYWVPIPNPDIVRPLFAHPTVKLDHGSNDRCFNCHLISDRNKYVANDGSGIMHTNVEKLCARCHGLVYKDWLSGTHGINRGMWRPKSVFDQERATCTECHNPHSPVFKFNEYAPPPTWPGKFIRITAEEEKNHKASSEYLKELEEIF